jgi:hypothetical protein
MFQSDARMCCPNTLKGAALPFCILADGPRLFKLL